MQPNNLCSSEVLHLQYNQKWISRSWLKQKCLPDMLKRCRCYVILVLETGLLFKEDALLLEDALQIEDAIAPAHDYRIKGIFFQSLVPNFTSGEKLIAAIAMGVCIASVPLRIPLFNRGNLIRVACWACASVSTPLLMRRSPPKHFPELVELMKEYTALVRRGIARARDNNALGRNSRSPPSEAMARLLIAQQKELSHILHSHIIFLRTECLDWRLSGQQWEDSAEFSTQLTEGNLTIIHNQYLLVQSMYLRILASTHLPIALRTPRMNQNKNTKLYILHSSILPQLVEIYQTHVYALKSAHAQHKKYQKLNIEDVSRKPFINMNDNNNSKDSWQYSELHNNTIMLSSELKCALQKCLELDGFLDACWNAKSKFSPSMLEDDLNKLKIEVFKCVNTIESMEIKIKKIKNIEVKLLEMALQKLPLPAVEEEDDSVNIKNVSEDTMLPIEDQVFYFVKNQDNLENFNGMQSEKAEDYLSAPGLREIAATKAVLGELRVKLVEREEVMRERERRALVSTMPEFSGNVPEFPRQMGKEFSEKNSNAVKNIVETCDKIKVNNDILKSVSSTECDKLDVNGKTKMPEKNFNSEEVNSLKFPDEIINESYSENSDSDDIIKNKTKQKKCDSCNLTSDRSCNCAYNRIERNDLLYDVRKHRTVKRKRDKPSKYNTNVNKSNNNPTEILDSDEDEENYRTQSKCKADNSYRVPSPNDDRKSYTSKKENRPRRKTNSKIQCNTITNEDVSHDSGDAREKSKMLSSIEDKSNDLEKSNHLRFDGNIKRELTTDGSNPITYSIKNIHDSDFLNTESGAFNPVTVKSLEVNRLIREPSGSVSNPTSEEIACEAINKDIAYGKNVDLINKELTETVNKSDSSENEKSNDERVKQIDGDVDSDSMKPTEYSFGTGLAMASLLQIPQNQKREGMAVKFPAMVHEEVFIGDGEVSDDSGNED